MPWRPAAPILGGMHGGQLHLTLHLRVSGESLTGRVGDGSGHEREFAGWVGLVAAIDRIVADAGERAALPERDAHENARRQA
jgi:hypothetical protein